MDMFVKFREDFEGTMPCFFIWYARFVDVPVKGVDMPA
jgi:hypothetical protein